MPRAPVQPWWRASGSCRDLEHIGNIRNTLAMLQSVGKHSQRQCLDLGNRVRTRLAISQHARQVGDLSDPSAIDFLLNFDLHIRWQNIRRAQAVDSNPARAVEANAVRGARSGKGYLSSIGEFPRIAF